MSPFALTAAFACVAVACGSLYLASKHQRLRAKPIATKPARAIAAVAACTALALLVGQMAVVPAVFTFVTAAMVALAGLPYLGALRPAPAKERKRRGTHTS